MSTRMTKAQLEARVQELSESLASSEQANVALLAENEELKMRNRGLESDLDGTNESHSLAIAALESQLEGAQSKIQTLGEENTHLALHADARIMGIKEGL